MSLLESLSLKFRASNLFGIFVFRFLVALFVSFEFEKILCSWFVFFKDTLNFSLQLFFCFYELLGQAKVLKATCVEISFCDFMSSDQQMLEKLEQIRQLLEKPPAPPPAPPKGLWKEFVDFISKYKVMGLAVAFIIGLYLGNVVQSLVKDLILPAIGLAVPGLGNLATIKLAVPSTTFDASGNPPAWLWRSNIWIRQLLGSYNYLCDCSFRYLPNSEDHQEMGHRVNPNPLLFLFNVFQEEFKII